MMTENSYPLVNVYSLLLEMAIEIVDLPFTHGDFPLRCKRLPEGTPKSSVLDWDSSIHRSDCPFINQHSFCFFLDLIPNESK